MRWVERDKERGGEGERKIDGEGWGEGGGRLRGRDDTHLAQTLAVTLSD